MVSKKTEIQDERILTDYKKELLTAYKGGCS